MRIELENLQQNLLGILRDALLCKHFVDARHGQNAQFDGSFVIQGSIVKYRGDQLRVDVVREGYPAKELDEEARKKRRK